MPVGGISTRAVSGSWYVTFQSFMEKRRRLAMAKRTKTLTLRWPVSLTHSLLVLLVLVHVVGEPGAGDPVTSGDSQWSTWGQRPPPPLPLTSPPSFTGIHSIQDWVSMLAVASRFHTTFPRWKTPGGVSPLCLQVTSADVLVTYLVLCFLMGLGRSFTTNLPLLFMLEKVILDKEGRVTMSDGFDKELIDDDLCDISLFATCCHGTTIAISMLLANIVWCRLRLLLSNDVESNPGPDTREGERDNVNLQSSEREDPKASADKNMDMDQLLAKITNSFQQQLNEQTSLLRGDLGKIKSEMCEIKDQCVEINKRCDKLEDEQHQLNEKIERISKVTIDIQKESEVRKDESARLASMMCDLKEEVGNMNNEIDRLEEFSRRDNLRMFGVDSVSGEERESYDDCCAAVCSALNHVDRDRVWSAGDIVRAHRVGRARPGQPQPMIVKFTHWRDKMKLITDKTFRAKLESEGVRVANDLTRRQMDFVAEAKREGKAAYFVKGKLTIGPKRPDPRTYTEVVSGQGVDRSNPLTPTPLSASGWHSPSTCSDVTGQQTRDSPVSCVGGQQRVGEMGEPLSRAATRQSTDGRQTGGTSARNKAPASGSGKQTGISGYLRGQSNSEKPAGGAASGRTLRSNVDARWK